MAYASITKPSLQMNTKLYTGTGSSNSLTGIGFQPDWVWLKERNGGGGHNTFDAVRGATKVIYTNASNAEATEAQALTSFDSDGFTLGTNTNVNESGINHAAWTWKANGQGSANTTGTINTTYTSANTTSGFSIIKYPGSGSNGTIGHGLGVAPSMVIIKDLSGTGDWLIGHDGLDATNPWHKYIYLNQGGAVADANTMFNDTAPTSTVINLGTHSMTNGSGKNYICYAFANVKGFSKFGKYGGNGNADGTFVYTGFKPGFLAIKKISDTGNWRQYDKLRLGYNVANYNFQANTADQEETAVHVDLLSNGFKWRTAGGGENDGSFIYMAFAEEPLVANIGTNGVPATAR